MMCAKCHASIPWYRVAWISRWTCVQCGACRQRWSRKLDVQACLVLAFMVAGILAVRQIEMGSAVRVALLVAWMVIGVFVDSVTVKLVPAKRAVTVSRERRTRP